MHYELNRHLISTPNHTSNLQYHPNCNVRTFGHQPALNTWHLFFLHSAIEHQCELGRISFKGALDLLKELLPKAAAYADQPRKIAQWKDELLTALATVKNPERPDRQKPRAKKRRRKTHQLLTKPRHEFKEIPHRETYRRKNDKAA